MSPAGEPLCKIINETTHIQSGRQAEVVRREKYFNAAVRPEIWSDGVGGLFTRGEAMMAMESQRAELDKLAIRSVIEGYSNAASRRDWTLLDQLFVDHATWSTRGTGVDRDIEGRENIVATISNAVDRLDVFLQMPSACWIEVDGDRATASTVVCERVMIDAVRGKVQYGIYYDELFKTCAGWRFYKRVFRTSYVDDAKTGQGFARADQAAIGGA
jgi:hypothetical protein